MMDEQNNFYNEYNNTENTQQSSDGTYRYKYESGEKIEPTSSNYNSGNNSGANNGSSYSGCNDYGNYTTDSSYNYSSTTENNSYGYNSAADNNSYGYNNATDNRSYHSDSSYNYNNSTVNNSGYRSDSSYNYNSSATDNNGYRSDSSYNNNNTTENNGYNNSNTYNYGSSNTGYDNSNTYSYSNNAADNNSAYSYGNYNYGSYSAPAGTPAYPEPKKKHPFLKAVKFVAAAACFGLIAGAAFFGVTYAANALFADNTNSVLSGSLPGKSDSSDTMYANSGLSNVSIGRTDLVQTDKNDFEEPDSVVVKVVEENLPATVAIQCTFVTAYNYWGRYYEQEYQGGGSGIIVGENETELLIATNNHVINDAKKIEISFVDGTSAEAVVKGTDSTADLAIVAVPLSSLSKDTLSQIHIAALGNSDEVKMGEMVVAIGNALGYGQSVTVGYVSAKDREVKIEGNTMILLQTDAAINEGNSGGPLFNTRGEVIGINSVKYADTKVEGMCFAIPISRAIPILNELMNREILTEEQQGYLGLSPKTVTSDIASFYGWPTGVYVASLVDGGAAQKAGIYVGDIITAVNGTTVTTDKQLRSAVTSYRYGTTVEITLQRMTDGSFKEYKVSVTLMKNPNLSSN